MCMEYKVYFKVYSTFEGKPMTIRYQITVEATSELSAKDKTIEKYNKSHYSNLLFEIVKIEERE